MEIKSRRIYGLPCVGSKGPVANIQLSLLETYAEAANLRTLVDLCGGGGHIALSADHEVFSEIIYNEIDSYMVDLMWALQDETRRNCLYATIDLLMSAVGDSVKLFKFASEQSKTQTPVKQESLDERFRSAVYGALLIYGSYRNDRRSADTGKKQLYLNEKGTRAAINSMRTRVVPGLADIQFMNIGAFEFLEKNKERNDVLVYIDPPYINDGKKDYNYAWDIEEHEKLTMMCDQSQLHIAICIGRRNSFGGGERYDALMPEDQPCYQRLIKSDKWHLYVCNDPDKYDMTGKANAIELMLCNFVIPGAREASKD